MTSKVTMALLMICVVVAMFLQLKALVDTNETLKEFRDVFFNSTIGRLQDTNQTGWYIP